MIMVVSSTERTCTEDKNTEVSLEFFFTYVRKASSRKTSFFARCSRTKGTSAGCKDSSHQGHIPNKLSVFRHNGFVESSFYKLHIFTVPQSLCVQRINVEAYNFRDVKCLFRADIFWRWRLSTSARTRVFAQGTGASEGASLVALWWES